MQNTPRVIITTTYNEADFAQNLPSVHEAACQDTDGCVRWRGSREWGTMQFLGDCLDIQLVNPKTQCGRRSPQASVPLIRREKAVIPGCAILALSLPGHDLDVPVRERSHHLLRACRLSTAAALRTAQAADQELRRHLTRRARCPDRRSRRAGDLRPVAQRAGGSRAEAALHSVGRCRHRSVRPCSAQGARHPPRQRAGRQCQRRFRTRDVAHSGAGPAAA